MANEITVIERTARDSMSLLFIYPITTPKQVGGANVVPTPSADLPAQVEAVVSPAEKTALDAGTMAFETVSFQFEPGTSVAGLTARAREIYASKLAEFNALYTKRFEYTGARINAA